jgi:apolipoprotein N-acyltransferase
VPPLCIIGWASPLTAAGVLFPGTGWFGIVGVLALIGSLRVCPRPVIFAAAVLATAANIVYHGDPAPPPGWEGVNTSFDSIGSDTADPVSAYQAAEWLQQRALESKAKVIIFPETVVPRWTEATEIFWEQTLAALAASGKTVVIGAGLPIPCSTRYENAVLIRGRGGPDSFLQRIPVPVGMWRPLRPLGVPLHLFGARVIRISDRRAAVLICYEQLLIWPILVSVAEVRPDVLLAVANDRWVGGSALPTLQTIVTNSWSRLFALPNVRAVNS